MLAAYAEVFMAISGLLKNIFQKSEKIQNNVLRIHYFRPDKKYDNLGIWFWEDVKQISMNWPDGATKPAGQDDFGIYFDIELNQKPSKVSFLILNINEARQLEANNTVYLGSNRNVFVVAGDKNVYDSSDLKIIAQLRQAIIIDKNTIKAVFSSMSGLDAQILAKNIIVKNNNGDCLKIASVSILEKSEINIKINSDLMNFLPLHVTFDDRIVETTVDWRFIDREFAYEDDDLGCSMDGNEAVVKVWSPLAEYATLCLYDKLDQTRLMLQKPMTKGKNGVWSCRITLKDVEIAGNKINSLIGYYYQYEIKNPGKEPLKCLDPYAKSMAPVTVNAGAVSAGSSGDFVGKAAIIDMNAIATEKTTVKIADYAKREDAIIYEAHVRDLTSDSSLDNRRTGRFSSFKALIGQLPYIKKLGFTHIELLPVMAWYYGDETRMGEPEYAYKSKNCNYNWGYDPQNYFTLDGAYSENPADAELRINELREFINAAHKEGIGVILDAVYTHMANTVFLNNIVPDYYFFKDPNGNLVGAFGNNVATTHKMAAKLIVDSVKFWFREYGIDGMRWDMMGDAVADVVQTSFNEAKKINPNVIFIGEAYKTTSVLQAEPGLADKMADLDWLYKTKDVGGYSDEIRDEIKSGYLHFGEGDPRFISGGARKIAKLFANLKGQPTGFKTSSPGSAVQYIEAHDNMTAFDSIAKATGLDPEIPEKYAELQRRLRLGIGLILTAQGTILFQAGLEYGKTKQWLTFGEPEQKWVKFADKAGIPFMHPYFIRDSYASSDAINKFDWEKATNAEKYPESVKTVEYSKGMIALRKSTDAFRLGSNEAVDANMKLLQIPEIKEEDLAIAYSCHSPNENKTYYIFANGDSKLRKFTLSENLTKAEIIVDASHAGITTIDCPNGVKVTDSQIELEPLTLAILRKA